MMDLNDNKYTYANLQILQIRRMMDYMLNPQDYEDCDLVNIGLDLLRILIEISAGVCHVTEDNEREWDLFHDAQKGEKECLFFIHDLYIKSHVKNQLLNEIISENKTEDLEKLIREIKGE